jgi:hypothetical protein
MKTLNKLLFFNLQQFNFQPLCERVLSNLFFLLWQLPQHGVYSGLAQIRLWKTAIVLVRKDLLAGLHALALAATANSRVYVGLGLMGVVSPLAGVAYLVFDRTAIDVEWYHLNYFHLFFLLGPYLSLLIILIGIFLLFPRGCKRAFAMVLPTGFVLAKILWLISVTSNQEFWQVVPASFVMLAMLMSAALFLMINWLTWTQFHGKDSFEKREMGIKQIAYDVDAEKFRSMVMETWRNKYYFNTKF